MSSSYEKDSCSSKPPLALAAFVARKDYTSRTMGAGFAKQLQRLRIARGLSVRQLARELGMPQTSYHAYERGVALPPLKRRPALARALGVELERLNELVEFDEYDVFLRARSLTAEGRAAVLDFVRDVREKERSSR